MTLTPEALEFFKKQGKEGGEKRWAGKTEEEKKEFMKTVRAGRTDKGVSNKPRSL